MVYTCKKLKGESMTKIRFCGSLILLFLTFCFSLCEAAESKNELQRSEEVVEVVKDIKWLGHASFKIKDDKVIYIDPWKLKTPEPADIILITHEHYDHCSPEDVKKIKKDTTWIVAPGDCASKFSGNVKVVQPNEKITVEGIEIETVSAYNLNKDFHPKSNQWVGYIVTVKGTRIYHTGDSDFVPEMKNLKVDVVLLPIGGTYTMNAEEAAQAANAMNPKVAIPMHYGTIVGSVKDVERFKKLCNVQVEVLEP